MTRIYDSPKFALRLNISAVVLVVVVIYGLFELYTAFLRSETTDSTGALFGIFFVGGGIWGAWQTWNDNRDKVAAFDVDEAAGTGVATLWRPFSPLKVAGPLDQFTRWRFQVKVAGRGVRTYYFLFRAPGYSNDLQMEIQRGAKLAEVFRRIAPTAVADYEDNTGSRENAAPAEKGSA
jgi:hypothetical protein